MEEKYPIGTFQFTGELTRDVIDAWIKDIEELPGRLREVVKDLHDDQLNTPYRSGGWTIRQVVHHLADSNINAYVRLHFALSEDNPVIKPFDEASWAQLSDYEFPIELSLSLLDALHIRWVQLLHNLNFEDMKKAFTHPNTGESTVGEDIGFYAWHGRHHLAHITSLCNQRGW